MFRATFGEAVIGVDAADFTVTGTTATVTGVAGVGAGPTYTQYDLTVSGGDLAALNGTVGLTFNTGAAANFITDLATNNLPKTAPATSQTYVVDNNAPTADVTDVTPDPRTSAVSTIAIVFNENVTGFDLADLSLTRDGGANLLTGAQTITGGPASYVLNNLSGITGTDGTYVLTVTAPGGITDAAGNAFAVNATDTWVKDAAVPTVTVAPAASQANPASAGPINFSAVFNEAVTGFAPADIAVTGTATYTGGTPVISITNPSSDGKTYNVAVSGMVTSGTVVIQVKAGAVQDQALNTNAASSLSTAVQFLTTTRKAKADFDGDGRSDVSVFRPSDGNWYLSNSTTGFAAVRWGVSSDVVVPGDYDGDGKADFAVWRPSNTLGQVDYYVLNSNGFVFIGYEHGIISDIPVAGDYDGDGKADLVVYRPSIGYWFVNASSTGITTSYQFGASGDVPFMMDSDGDGKSNFVMFRPSDNTWYISRATGAPATDFDAVQFGTAGDILVPGDYDGDNKDDVAVFRPSNGVWYIRRSLDSTVASVQFGYNGDVPVPGDYDGDGKDDTAVFRGGVWYINRSTSGFAATSFGTAADIPVPARYHP